MSILDQSAQSLGNFVDPVAALIKNPFQKKVSPTGEMSPDFPEGFFIVEYVAGLPQDGSGGRPNTALQLTGTNMPMQPFPWSGEQRMVKTYYPGNKEPSVHLLGAKENEVTIKGKFKDKRYQDPAYYGVSYQFTKALEAMRKRGNVLKFGMYGQAGDWVRYGFLEKGEFKLNKLSEIEYDVTFFVVGDKLPKNNNFASPEKSPSDGINQALLNQASIFAARSLVPTTMPQSLGDVLNDITNGVASNIAIVTGFVDTVISAAVETEAAAFRVVGLVKNARAAFSSYRRQIGALATNFNQLSSQSDPALQATESYKNYSYLVDTSSSIYDIDKVLAQLSANFSKIAVTIPISRHLVVAGDTLQRLSIKFYGSADNWKNIYDHNKLHSTVLVEGTVLEIPRL